MKSWTGLRALREYTRILVGETALDEITYNFKKETNIYIRVEKLFIYKEYSWEKLAKVSSNRYRPLRFVVYMFLGLLLVFAISTERSCGGTKLLL